MAISQEKFVNITTKRSGGSALISGFKAILVCDSSNNSENGATIVVKTFNSYAEFQDDTATAAKMSTNSAKAVQKFFAINSNRAALTVVINAGSGSISDCIAAVTSNWHIAFSADYQDTTVTEPATTSEVQDFVTAVNTNGGIAVAFTTLATASAAISALQFSSDSVIKMAGANVEDCAIIPSIAASTDYLTAIKKYFMADVGATTPYCKSDTDFDALEAAHFNFVGQIKTFGSSIVHLLGGVTSKGTDLVSYLGQLWLEATCKDNILSLMSNEIITAGNAIPGVLGQVILAAEDGIANGLIIRGKQFTSAEAEDIITKSGGDADAVSKVSTNGYWVSASLSGNKVNYILIYADATGIKKVDGTHYIV